MEFVLDQRVLRLLVTLAEELHFGRAAARLHVSQPTLSGAVKNVERSLGVQLFNRSTRHVELTRAGELMLTEAHRLIEHAERAISRIRETAADFAGPFRIGYSPAINLPQLSQLIARMTDRRILPMPVELVSAQSLDLETSLARGTLQAAFLLGPAVDHDLKPIHLQPAPFCLALGASHPLADSRSIRFKALEKEPIVWLRRDWNAPLCDAFDRACASLGYHPPVAQEVGSFYECLQFARQSLAIAVVPSYMRQDRYDGIVFRDLPRPLVLSENLIVRRDNPIAPLTPFIRFVTSLVRANRRRHS